MKARKTNDNFYKNLLSKFFTVSIFIGCTTFVAIRGTKCFQKFLEKPQNSKMSYQFIGSQIFPKITICEIEEDSYDNEALTQCGLNVDNYIENGPWVGSGNDLCINPKELFNNVSFKPERLEIQWIEVKTFKNKYFFNSDDVKDFLSNIVPYAPDRKCLRMTMPKNLTIEGKTIDKQN